MRINDQVVTRFRDVLMEEAKAASARAEPGTTNFQFELMLARLFSGLVAAVLQAQIIGKED